MVQSLRHLGLAAGLALVASVAAGPAAADLSAFVAAVGFDEDANLEGSPGIGLRWGASSGILGGETSLLIARPDREVETTAGSASEGATAIFYEGRFLLNIPAGRVKPFVGVGFGAITIFPGELKVPGADADDLGRQLQTLDALSKTETNQAFSYGAGARFALNERIDARADVRQYQVFSVKGAIAREVAQQVEVPEELRELLPAKEHTVQYSELSAGIVFRF